MTVGVLSRMTVGVISRITVGVLSGMTAVVIPAKAGIQELFLSSNIREKKTIDSCLKISGITENENDKEKHWIPNQVGDDIVLSFRT